VNKTNQPLPPRYRILNAAKQLFYEQGYHATGINQIITEAQVVKASFYQHFPSKEALGVAYLEQRSQLWFAWVRAAASQQKDPRDRVLALFNSVEEAADRVGFRGCAFLNMVSEFPDGDTPIRQSVIKHKMAIRDYFRELIDAFYPSSTPPEERMECADTIYLLFESALIVSQTYGEPWPIRTARNTVQRMLS
jgi:AcrR family transcriptional regulator